MHGRESWELAFAEHSKRPSFFSIKESNSEIFEISLR
jgi:hypothetical protein